MDAQSFWNVIGHYNQDTVIIQIILLVFIAFAIILERTSIKISLVKIVLGIANLFIGVVFFGFYGTKPIQKFFALPLYIICGTLFLYEAWRNKTDRLNKFHFFQIILLVLYVLYPIISYIFGNRFPQMVTHIMPCPIVSLSIAIYASYSRKNRLLLLLLTIWGLTGIKSVVFSAYEDIILFICGIYGVYLLAKEIKCNRVGRTGSISNHDGR